MSQEQLTSITAGQVLAAVLCIILLKQSSQARQWQQNKLGASKQEESNSHGNPASQMLRHCVACSNTSMVPSCGPSQMVQPYSNLYNNVTPS